MCTTMLTPVVRPWDCGLSCEACDLAAIERASASVTAINTNDKTQRVINDISLSLLMLRHTPDVPVDCSPAVLLLVIVRSTNVRKIAQRGHCRRNNGQLHRRWMLVLASLGGYRLARSVCY
jgi:hypothetical protein